MIIAISALIFLTLVNTALFFCLYKVLNNLDERTAELDSMATVVTEKLIKLEKDFDMSSVIRESEKGIHEDHCKTLSKELKDLAEQADKLLKELGEKVEQRYSDIYEQYSEIWNTTGDIADMVGDIWSVCDEDGCFDDEENENQDPPEKLEHIVVDIDRPIYGQMEMDGPDGDETS